MRSEPEMLDLVRQKLVRLRRRRRLAVGGTGLVVLVGGLGFVAATGHRDDDHDRVRTTADVPQPTETSLGPATSEPAETTTPPPDAVVAVPDVLGTDVDHAVAAITAAGLGNGLDDIDLRYIADDGMPAGIVMGQDPLAGSVVDVRAAIVLRVSAGGPAVGLDDLPAEARSFVEGLDDRDLVYDPSEPILLVDTEQGTAYKTDNWLFGPCAAVEAAYRTFPDPTYADDCY